MIDSHTHLDSTPGEDAEILARARAQGVKRILTVGTNPASCAAAIAAAEAHDDVFAAVGHHPNNASDYTGTDWLRELARHPKVRAIGETGLDYFRDYAPRDAQKRAFDDQIELAREVGKPLVVHTRAAEDDTLDALVAKAEGLDVILHCFSMADYLDACLRHERWWFSFAGNVTYPNASGLADAAAAVPLERLLVETDAPYLSPQRVRKERNQPANVVLTAEFVAERRGITYGELETAVEANAATLFGW